MIINWDFVKKKTLWGYEDLIKKLYQALSYEFVQQSYNHTMDEAIDYVNEVHAGYLQHRGDRAWLDDLITNFTWLKRVSKIISIWCNKSRVGRSVKRFSRRAVWAFPN